MKFISDLDARLKLLISLSLIVLTISSSRIVMPIIIFVITLFVVMTARIRLKSFFVRMIEPFIIALIIVLLKSLTLFSSADVMFDMKFFSIGLLLDGFAEGISIASRIIAAMAIVILFSFVSSLNETIKALLWIRLPKTIVEILLLAHKYVFAFADDAKVIYNAQKNRLGYSTVSRSLRSIGVLSGALVIKAFDSSQALTLAMTQRGFDGNIALMQLKPLSKMQIFVSVLWIVFFCCMWIIFEVVK